MELKMRVWLDDIRNPSNPFIQKRFGAKGNEIWAKTVPDAIELLKLGTVEFLSFDNDLGYEEDEGIKLAQWIEEKSFLGEIEPLNWAIHSQNPVARKHIEAAMKNADKYWRNHQNEN